MEIPCRAGVLQIHLDHRARAGACHNARHPSIIQRGQQLFQALFAGHALGEPFVSHLPDLVQQPLRVAGDVFCHLAAQVIPRQPAAAGAERRQILRQRQPQRLAGRFPHFIPQPLRVKHQAVHIKNNAFNHRCHPFQLKLPVLYRKSTRRSTPVKSHRLHLCGRWQLSYGISVVSSCRQSHPGPAEPRLQPQRSAQWAYRRWSAGWSRSSRPWPPQRCCSWGCTHP